MKYYAIFIFVICIASTAYGMLAASAIDTLIRHQNDCIIETGTSTNDVEYSRQYGKFCDDGHMDKFALCLLKKYKIIKSDGSISQNSDEYSTYLMTDDPFAPGKVHRCTTLRGDNELHTARKIINCALLESNAQFFAPRPRNFS